MRDWTSLVGNGESLIVEPLAAGVTRLSETAVSLAERSFFYLIQGSELDCLVDGGWGFCRSLDTIRADPRKPLVAIGTHSHFDHIGALHLAQKCYGHASETAIFQNPDPAATQALPYLAGLSVFADGSSVAPETIRQTPCPLRGFLADGDAIDLGGRSLRVIHTPGHSPGSLSLVDERNGLLFCADTVHDGHIHDDIPGADRAALLMSHERLAEVDFMQACPGHGATLRRDEVHSRIARYRRETGG